MDPDVLEGTAYYDILVDVSSSLDFLMPQYYNGYTRASIDGIAGTGAGSVSAFSHYENLVDNMFGGDATKVVFGFCIADCSGTGSNASGDQAKQVMVDLGDYYSCNGGAFFWVADDDNGGLWSSKINSVIQPNAGCSIGVEPPTSPPSAAPITPSPTILPTIAPPTPTNPLVMTTAPSTSAPTPPPSSSPVVITPAPTAAPVDSSSCCPVGFTGMVPTNGCTQFFYCDGNGGINGSPIRCPAGLLFNKDGGYCDWDYNVLTCEDCPVPENRKLLRG